jgi:hypothetical protein
MRAKELAQELRLKAFPTSATDAKHIAELLNLAVPFRLLLHSLDPKVISPLSKAFLIAATKQVTWYSS